MKKQATSYKGYKDSKKTSSKKMEDLVKPLQFIRKFHFVIAPILTLFSVLSMTCAGEFDFSDFGEHEYR